MLAPVLNKSSLLSGKNNNVFLAILYISVPNRDLKVRQTRTFPSDYSM